MADAYALGFKSPSGPPERSTNLCRPGKRPGEGPWIYIDGAELLVHPSAKLPIQSST